MRGGGNGAGERRRGLLAGGLFAGLAAALAAAPLGFELADLADERALLERRFDQLAPGHPAGPAVVDGLVALACLHELGGQHARALEIAERIGARLGGGAEPEPRQKAAEAAAWLHLRGGNRFRAARARALAPALGATPPPGLTRQLAIQAALESWLVVLPGQEGLGPAPGPAPPPPAGPPLDAARIRARLDGLGGVLTTMAEATGALERIEAATRTPGTSAARDALEAEAWARPAAMLEARRWLVAFVADLEAIPDPLLKDAQAPRIKVLGDMLVELDKLAVNYMARLLLFRVEAGKAASPAPAPVPAPAAPPPPAPPRPKAPAPAAIAAQDLEAMAQPLKVWLATPGPWDPAAAEAQVDGVLGLAGLAALNAAPRLGTELVGALEKKLVAAVPPAASSAARAGIALHRYLALALGSSGREVEAAHGAYARAAEALAPAQRPGAGATARLYGLCLRRLARRTGAARLEARARLLLGEDGAGPAEPLPRPVPLAAADLQPRAAALREIARDIDGLSRWLEEAERVDRLRPPSTPARLACEAAGLAHLATLQSDLEGLRHFLAELALSKDLAVTVFARGQREGLERLVTTLDDLGRTASSRILLMRIRQAQAR